MRIIRRDTGVNEEGVEDDVECFFGDGDDVEKAEVENEDGMMTLERNAWLSSNNSFSLDDVQFLRNS